MSQNDHLRKILNVILFVCFCEKYHSLPLIIACTYCRWFRHFSVIKKLIYFLYFMYQIFLCVSAFQTIALHYKIHSVVFDLKLWHLTFSSSVILAPAVERKREEMNACKLISSSLTSYFPLFLNKVQLQQIIFKKKQHFSICFIKKIGS